MNDAIRRLKSLLEDERQALLAGDLERVGALIEEKVALTDHLEKAPLAELKSMSGLLNRNAALLAAAKDGVGDVVTTLRKQKAARTTLSTYDSAGRPAQISNTRSGTERRF